MGMAVRFRSSRALPAAALPVVIAAAMAPASAATAHSAAPQGWRIVKTIKVANLQLDDVVALSGGRAWATGSAGAPVAKPLLYHLTGGKWVKVARPGVDGGSVFATDLSATSDSNVWAAIANGGAFDHWNGHAWTRISFGTGGTAAADGVAAVGTNRAWAFTTDFTASPVQETAHFFNGSTWAGQVLPGLPDADASFSVFSAPSASDIWTWAIDTTSHAWEALHFNGSTWAVVTIPATLIPHHGSSTGGGGQMLALSAKNVWASVVSENLAGPMVLLHWNGTTWQKAGGHPPAGELLGPIAPDGQGGLWLYAAKPLATHPFLRPFFVHYHGGTWTTVAAPVSRLGPILISAIALIPGTRSLWGVGSIQKSQSSVGGVIIKFGS
jgi:hypothetical protein